MSVYEQLGYTAALLQLGCLSAEDIRTRTVSAKQLCIWGMASMVYFAAGNVWSLQRMAGAILPGILLLAIALLTDEKIGYGDGAAVLVLGVWTGGMFCGLMVCLGFCLSGMYAFGQQIRRRKEPIPFLPFLLGAMEVMLFYG